MSIGRPTIATPSQRAGRRQLRCARRPSVTCRQRPTSFRRTVLRASYDARGRTATRQADSAAGARLQWRPRSCAGRERPRCRDDATSPPASRAVSCPALRRRRATNATMMTDDVQGDRRSSLRCGRLRGGSAAGRRRSGFVVVAAVFGLAVLGTAGAFAYRAMFGGSMLPSLPPIIKADDGPNKIMPSQPQSQRVRSS